MNIQQVITEIEKVDPEVYDRMNPRRKVIQQFAKLGGKLALSAVPLALGSMFSKAYGRGTNGTILEVLQYALTLEYLEAEFYTKAVASGIVPAGAPTGAFTTIRDHENAHVTFLKAAITASGGTPIAKPTFDFSAGNGSGNGPFKAVFTDYGLLLAVAQTFEDTGVRAYKGRAAELISNNDVLTAALQIHSVEARHAAHIRYMRRNFLSNTTIKPWITGKDTGGIGAAVQASYNGEDLAVQAGITITNINGMSISVDAATEAFDEPLTDTQVLAIVDPFIA
ncbi:ferritin-like domain-containing protein [Paraflavitalea pollutisoli]|uniref:ferritin-like domain-containing protein n=1 Tax=Paraflavitalea pollutisoli TaxID=3034143 RepID=UPI0023EC6ABD|nr:ferritin-like domain-containing protein [Paraflavitalea sp. H1-2-19X]